MSHPRPFRRTDRIRRHYEPRLHQNLENYRVLDWASPQSQRARFQVLADRVDLAGKSLLDVGCGLADLWDYLRERGIAVRYTGLDLLEGMVQSCRQRVPEAAFLRGDLFAEEPCPVEPHDVVYCSGALNLNLGNNLEFLPRALRRMFDLSREALVVNMLHIRAAPESDRYFSYDPDFVLEIIRPWPCRGEIVEDYLINDFTLICRR